MINRCAAGVTVFSAFSLALVMSRRTSSIDHDSSGRRLVRRSQDHSDTHRTLQEALEDVSDHIRHVRRSLLRLTEAFPEPSTTGTSNSERDSVNPGHEALVLSGGTIDEPEHDVTAPGRADDGRSSTPPSPNRSHPSMPTDPPTFTHAPSVPRVLPPRFSRQNMSGPPDSAATTHGLRVAAREAANSNSNSTANSLRVSGDAPRDSRATAWQFERLMARRVQGVAQDAVYPDNSRFRSATRERADHVVPPSLPSGSAPPYPFDSFVPIPVQYNRLNYLPLPPVPAPARPIQRHLSNRPRHPSTTVGPNDEFIDDDIGLGGDQFIPWLYPSQQYAPPRRDPYNPETSGITRANEPTHSHPDLQPRRRGWARLDPDGDEIPWDEEEELERSRTAYRLGVLQRAHEESNGPEILRHDGRTFHGSVLDSMLSVPATPPRTNQWRSPTTDTQSRPFWVDPLPMPLSSMMGIEEPHEDDYHPDVIVSRHACLAGR